MNGNTSNRHQTDKIAVDEASEPNADEKGEILFRTWNPWIPYFTYHNAHQIIKRAVYKLL